MLHSLRDSSWNFDLIIWQRVTKRPLSRALNFLETQISTYPFIEFIKKKWLELKTLDTIYWSRAGLGLIVAILCAALGFDTILSGMSLALMCYLIVDILLRRVFKVEVEDPSKLFSMGIGAYFIFWIASWILLYSFLHPAGWKKFKQKPSSLLFHHGFFLHGFYILDERRK